MACQKHCILCCNIFKINVISQFVNTVKKFSENSREYEYAMKLQSQSLCVMEKSQKMFHDKG